MLWPPSVPRASADVTSKKGQQRRLTLVIVACAISAAVLVLAILLLLLLHRLRVGRLRGTQRVRSSLSLYICLMGGGPSRS